MRPWLTNARVTQEMNLKVSWLTWEHFSPSHHLIYLGNIDLWPAGFLEEDVLKVSSGNQELQERRPRIFRSEKTHTFYLHNPHWLP